MICPNCGAELQEDDVFCCHCGYKVEKPIEDQMPTVETFSPDEKPQGNRCPNCGAKVEKDSLFCVHCGYRLSSPTEKNTREPSLNVPVGDAGVVQNGQPEMICVMCGCKIPASSRVCPICQQPTGRYAREPRRVYRYEERPRVRRKPFNVFALIGFIFGLLSLLTLFSSGAGIVLSIPGLVLSIIGLVKSKKTKSGKGFAIAGLVLSAVTIVIFILAIMVGLLGSLASVGTGVDSSYPNMDTDFWGNGNMY